MGLRVKSRATLEAENLILRQQLNIVTRKLPKQLRLRNLDRLPAESDTRGAAYQTRKNAMTDLILECRSNQSLRTYELTRYGRIREPICPGIVSRSRLLQRPEWNGIWVRHPDARFESAKMRR